jgi:hypothetical protein
MSSPEFKPWWTKVNEYLAFQEKQQFTQGANGLNPNLRHDVLMGMLSAGYMNDKFERPQSHTGKKN